MTVSDTSGSDTDTFTWTVSPPANVPPVVDSASITPVAPVTDDTLTAQVASHDADGNTLTTSYQWSRNGTPIAGATGATLNLATAGNGDRGDLIRVTVSVNDGTVSSAPSTSDPVTIVNSPPVFSTDLADRSSDTVGDLVNLDADATDADGDAVTYSATDLPAGVTIAPATGVISGTLTAPAGTHSVTVTASDASGSDTDTFTWTVSPPANAAPVVDSVTIAPLLPATGQTLTATVTSHDAENSPLTTSYQWRRNTIDIVGATSSTLNLATAGNGDRGDQISVRVTVNDGQATSAPVTSDPVTVVNSSPVLTTDIQNRSNTVGDTVNLDADATDADADTLTYSATDLPAGVTIAPATGVISGTLTAPAGTHSVTVTVSDGTATATDTFTWTVAAANTAPVVDSVTIAPTSPTTGQTLTATVTSHDAEGSTADDELPVAPQRHRHRGPDRLDAEPRDRRQRRSRRRHHGARDRQRRQPHQQPGDLERRDRRQQRARLLHELPGPQRRHRHLAGPRCRCDRCRWRRTDLQRHRSARRHVDRARLRRHQRHADGTGRPEQRHDHRQRRQWQRDRHVHLDGHPAGQHGAGGRLRDDRADLAHHGSDADGHGDEP